MPKFFRPQERVDFAAYLDSLPGPYLILHDETGRLPGCGGHAVSREHGSADLCWGMVARDLDGRGYRRLLARTRISRLLDDAAVRQIKLSTSQHTVAFYERLDFQITAVENDGYAPGLDRYEMRLQVRR